MKHWLKALMHTLRIWTCFTDLCSFPVLSTNERDEDLKVMKGKHQIDTVFKSGVPEETRAGNIGCMTAINS